MHPLVKRVEAEILGRGLVPLHGRLLVAVSGGVDSMVLLRVLRELARRHQWKLLAAHCNHGLRGRSSQADERLVKTVCHQWKLPCLSGAVEVRKRAKQSGASIEMAAREVRHEFLSRVARQKKIHTVALGHHADDQVELFFLRLLRGSSSLGLSGMKWSGPSPVDSRVMLVRPLLGCSRSELLEFASEQRVRYREDATNTNLDIQRNRLRHQVLPKLLRFQPVLQRIILRQMELLGAESELISGLASNWRTRKDQPFNGLPLAVQRAVLREAITESGLDAEYELMEALRASPGQAVTFPGGISVLHDGEGRVIKAPSRKLRGFNAQRFPLQFDGRDGEGTFGGLKWKWRVTTGAEASPAFGPGHEWFDADQVGSEVLLRHWAPGDRFRPCGARFTAKLQDLFTNQKIPEGWRKQLVVASTADGRLWWVEGLRIGDAFKLSPTTRTVLHWTWERQASPDFC